MNPEIRKKYRQIAHHLKPVVMISENGLTDGVVAELQRALEDHELIKIKLAVNDREQRKALLSELCQLSHAELVQSIGKIAVVYRAASQPNPRLSNILRQTGNPG